VDSAWAAGYAVFVLLIIAALATFDIIMRRVPNKALLFFCAVALAAPAVYALDPNSSVFSWSTALRLLLPALSGAAVGFTVLLAAAIASKGGNGVGGGDIKLAAVLGFVYGPAGIITILLAASLLALPTGLIYKLRTGGKILRLPFVPFIALGCLIVTFARLT